MLIEELDLKLKLMSGSDILVDGQVGSIKPLTLRQIVDYGYSNYLKKLNLIALEVDDFIPPEEKVGEMKDINLFEIFVYLTDKETLSELIDGLSLFFQDKVEFIEELGVVIIGENVENARVIDRECFDNVREVLKWQNCINKFGENEVKVSDKEESEAVRKIKERLKKSKEAIQKAKRMDSEGEENESDISDIISAVATKSNSLNKTNIFDLTMFQLYDEFKRLELVDQYFLSIKSMLAGAKDVKLKHWSSKLDW